MAAMAAVVGLAGAWAVGVVGAAPTAAQQEPLKEMVLVVNAFKPPDALTAASVGGSVGGPIVLTGRDELAAAAERALRAADADLAVMVGGTAVLADGVVDEVVALGYEVRRVAGATRTETAAELVDFVGEQGYGRPVLTDREVAAGTVPGLDAETLQGLTPDELGGGDAGDRFDELEARLDDLAAENTGLRARVDELERLLAGVTRDDVDGRDTLQFDGMNVQVVNGTDTTDGEPNGLGNLIVGYHEDFTCDPTGDGCPTISDNEPDERTGSHMLVTGIDHSYTSFGGLVAGADNTTSGDYATVSGGHSNTASSRWASVSGGGSNTASDFGASVSGGIGNSARHVGSSVSGGRDNVASGPEASVSGGEGNLASGHRASVSGGHENLASVIRASILGGADQTVNTVDGCHPECAQ